MRILLAENERSVSRALVTILRKNNFETDAVDNGEDALAYLLTGNYDGAILELALPGLGGIDVLRRVRAAGEGLPILMLTANAGAADKVLALNSGANDCMTRPFASQELLARVRAMTRSRGRQSPHILSLGNITLNQSTCELSSPHGCCRLTNKEFQIMEMLLSNPRSLVPAERMMEHIWGYDNTTGVSVLWVYISSLRKKLAALQASICIRMTRNAGYSVEETT